MLKMGPGLGCYQELRQCVYPSPAQELGLKQLLSIEQKLKHPEFPEAVKGLEGMQIAHKMLQERRATGVLIGGLAEAVWNQQRTLEELYAHKDVDVAVLDDHFELQQDFEGGVDWWVPKKGRITVASDVSSNDHSQKWYENGNGLILSFGLNLNTNLNPGLYIPDSEWVVDMKMREAEAHVDYGSGIVEIDESVLKKFEDKVREKIKNTLPHFISEAFVGYILSPSYVWDYHRHAVLSLEQFDLKTIATINGLKGGESKNGKPQGTD